MAAEAGTVHQPFLYDATQEELEEFLLLGLFVAGKNAIVQQRKLHWFLERLREHVLRSQADWFPMQRISALQPESLEQHLRYCGAGQYRRLVPALLWLSEKIPHGELDLKTCTRDELCACPGIGYKTASFFLIYTRRDATHACLDTHILRWLREECGHENVPKSSPQGKKQYEKWEQIYLAEAEKLGENPTTLDFELWLKYSKKN